MPRESSRAAGVRTYPTTVPYVQPAVMTKINSKTRTYPVFPFEKKDLLNVSKKNNKMNRSMMKSPILFI
jgi:hypothetical protein